MRSCVRLRNRAREAVQSRTPARTVLELNAPEARASINILHALAKTCYIPYPALHSAHARARPPGAAENPKKNASHPSGRQLRVKPNAIEP